MHARMRPAARIAPLALALLIAGCATQPPPAPPPPPPKPAPAPPPPPTDWRDLTETNGNWRYVSDAAAPTAQFETTAGATLFTVRCDKAVRRIAFVRADAPSTASLKITTSYGSRTLAPPSLAASDTFLDQIAFSRGRFTIETAGLPELVLPAWAEPARVIEDCR